MKSSGVREKAGSRDEQAQTSLKIDLGEVRVESEEASQEREGKEALNYGLSGAVTPNPVLRWKGYPQMLTVREEGGEKEMVLAAPPRCQSQSPPGERVCHGQTCPTASLQNWPLGAVGPGARLSRKVPLGDDASVEQRGTSVPADRQEPAGGRGKTKGESNQQVKGREERVGGLPWISYLFSVHFPKGSGERRVDLSTVASLVGGVSLTGSRVRGGFLGERLGPHGLLRVSQVMRARTFI